MAVPLTQIVTSDRIEVVDIEVEFKDAELDQLLLHLLNRVKDLIEKPTERMNAVADAEAAKRDYGVNHRREDGAETVAFLQMLAHPEGGALQSEPADRPWGVRMCQFKDLDGFKLGISTPLAK